MIMWQSGLSSGHTSSHISGIYCVVHDFGIVLLVSVLIIIIVCKILILENVLTPTKHMCQEIAMVKIPASGTKY